VSSSKLPLAGIGASPFASTGSLGGGCGAAGGVVGSIPGVGDVGRMPAAEPATGGAGSARTIVVRPSIKANAAIDVRTPRVEQELRQA
jgi:hypothetical protein